MKWVIGKEYAAPGDTVAINVMIQAADLEQTVLNSFNMAVTADNRLTAGNAEVGQAYVIPFTSNTADISAMYFAGTSTDSANISANTAYPVFTMYFDVPTDAQAGDTFEINFNTDQLNGKGLEILRAELNATVNVETENGWIKVLDQEPTYEYTYEYSAQGDDMFYLSHDPRPFDPADMTGTLYRQAYQIDEEGNRVEYGEPVQIPITSSKVKVKLVTKEGGLETPKATYDAQNKSYVAVPLVASVVENTGTDAEPVWSESKELKSATDGGEVLANAWIGVKGDTNLNGDCNAEDASYVLIYAAKFGAGEDANLTDIAGIDLDGESGVITTAKGLGVTRADADIVNRFAYFLSDTNGESPDYGIFDADGKASVASALNAIDAANQLVYAAKVGANGSANWATDVMVSELDAGALPRHTREIHQWELDHPDETPAE